MKNKFYKKGELTTQQIVGLIILIVSFTVILFFIFRLNLQEETDEQICHNSVILKGKSILQGGSSNLDCKTSYVCISGGGNCENINPTKNIGVDSSNENEIFNAIAEEMSKCWWMFGEGEIDYAGGGTKTDVNYALCDVIAFDGDIIEDNSDLTYQDFYNYLAITKKSDSQTYLQYIYSTNSIENVDVNDEVKISLSDELDFSKKYSVVTGIDKNLADFIDDDEFFGVYVFPSDESDSRLDDKRNFLTKA